VTVTATPERAQVTSGDRLAVAVVMQFKDGYHAWPAEAQHALTPEIAEFAVHTDIVAGDLPPAVSAVGDVQWPTPHEVTVADPTGAQATVQTKAYTGRAVFYVPVAIAADAAAGPVTLEFTVSYQVCDDKQCLMPEDVPVQVTLNVVTDAAAAAGSATDPSLFAGFEARRLAELGGGSPGRGAGDASAAQADPDGASSSASPSTAESPRPSLFGYEMPDLDGPLGLLVLLLISALGGAILNLTPCVLPVIPIKIMTLSKHAADPGRRLALGAWMALGVVAFWVAIGLPMAFINSTADPSRWIFGNWYVVLAIGLGIAVLGVGSMGLFEIKLPRAVYSADPKADSAAGSFLFGIMTAVLGLPCFGFVAGGLLAGAAVLGAAKIMAIFTGLGLGMAAPYLLLSAYPALINRVPRTGPASALVKQVMGLLLLAAAGFFITAGVKGLLSDMPYLTESIGWWVVAVLVVAAAAWLTLRTFQITKKAVPRILLPVVAMLAVAGIVVFASGLTSVARADYLRLEAARGQEDGGIVTGAWLEYTAGRLQQARAADKIIIVDFTADWCINCKALKRAVLDREPVRPRLLAGDVVMLEVDLTSSRAPGWAFLQELGQTGVPTLAIYGPGLADPIIYNAYTPEVVLKAIERAASGTQSTSAAP
jgi:thiol:disulfide interchange protein DsbD